MFISVHDLFDPDMLCFLCLQPAVDYRGLAVTGSRKVTQAGDELQGLCYSEGCQYVVEGQGKLGRDSTSLTVYRVQSDSGDITWLDTLTGLGEGGWCPRVDRYNHRVFVPCRYSGVTVARLDGDRLVRERTLTCVSAISVGVMSADTVYVGDYDSYRVHVVDIRNDRITATLETPDTVRGVPASLAVLGDSVIVCYGNFFPLVVYRHGGSSPIRVIPLPVGLKYVYAISTDCHSNYLVTDWQTRSVFVIDTNGDLRDTVNIHTDRDTDSWPEDCAVVNRQLWVGFRNGYILMMSSQ